MEHSIGGLIATASKKFGNKKALVVGEKSWSFREIDDASSILAGNLERLGVRPGDAVSLYSPNCFEWVVSYYAILKLGGIVNPLNLMLTPSEAAYAIDDCGAVAILGELSRLLALKAEAGFGGKILVSFGEEAEGIESLVDLLVGEVSQCYPLACISEDDVSTIAYTSGTTGKPKGAVLSHRAILMNTAMTATMHLRTSSDTVVSALPCSHVYGNIVMNAAMAYGMTLVLHEVFKEAEILESIVRHKATIFEGVPTMYMYLLNFPELAKYDVSSLTRCTVGGQTMPVAKMENVEKALGVPLLELWGMTELGGLGTTHSFYGPKRLGSIGLPLPSVEVRIGKSGDSAKTLPNGEVGELLVKGPITMRGYLNRADATAEALDSDGWLHTGDLAYQDSDGYVFVVDRLKDMIITGGYNVYPAELERVLSEHPGVALAAVAGVPDELKGELATAFIVRAQGSNASESEIIDFCRTRLAAYKVPRKVHFVDDLPKTSSGKIMRRMLREVAH